jgi:hypothetical protein
MEDVKILLLVLEKAEQILSLVNLPESTIKKYNELKQLCCSKLKIDFFPLQKSSNLYSNDTNQSNIYINHIFNLKEISNKKDIIINHILNTLDSYIINPSSLNYYNNQPQGLNSILNKQQKLKFNIEDLEFELKTESINISEIINKADSLIKQISILSTESKSFPKHNKEVNDIMYHFERKIEEIKIQHENELLSYKDRFDQLRRQYNPDLEEEYYKLLKTMEEYKYIVEQTCIITEPLYEKFHHKDLNFNMEAYKYKELEMVCYLNNVLIKFYNDNKYLVDVVNQLEHKTNDFEGKTLKPFVSNAIQKNEKLIEIKEEIEKVENGRKETQRKFIDLMQFITNNFNQEELVEE